MSTSRMTTKRTSNRGPGAQVGRRPRRTDEDDDILAPDDVEADLDTILKDRLVAADDEGGRGRRRRARGPQRGRAIGCSRSGPTSSSARAASCSCATARPVCPVGDDDCPLFSKQLMNEVVRRAEFADAPQLGELEAAPDVT